MNKFTKQTTTTNRRIIFLGFVIYLGFSILNLVFAKRSFAQTLGLSISPPINEIMIIPGKVVTQTFTITNDGEDGMASLYIIPMRPQGEGGNIALDEKNAITPSSPYASWFNILTPVNKFGEKFFLASGASQKVVIQISPNVGAPEKDYYFTLLYELDSEVTGSIAPQGPTNQARIGSNMLISLSVDGNPPKYPKIIEFKAPRLIDSLEQLKFNIRVNNYGSFLFKSNGNISIKSLFGDSENLKLAPMNVLSDSTRNIPCIDGENLIDCKSNKKVLLGLYTSTLDISADDSGASVQASTTTVALPFSGILVVLIIFAIYKIIKNAKNMAK